MSETITAAKINTKDSIETLSWYWCLWNIVGIILPFTLLTMVAFLPVYQWAEKTPLGFLAGALYNGFVFMGVTALTFMFLHWSRHAILSTLTKILGLVKVGWKPMLVGVGVGAAGVLLSFVVAFIVSLFGDNSQPNATSTAAALYDPWVLFLGAVLVAPVVEEVFFRGYIFGTLMIGAKNSEKHQKLYTALSILITSILFGLAHFSPGSGLISGITTILSTMTFSVGLCWMRLKWGSIIPGMLSHALYNLIVLLLVI